MPRHTPIEDNRSGGAGGPSFGRFRDGERSENRSFVPIAHEHGEKLDRRLRRRLAIVLVNFETGDGGEYACFGD